MRERPILFNGDMVRAILAGTKTQTRRPAPIKALSFTHHPEGLIAWAVQFMKAVKGVLASYSGGTFTEEVARSIIASQFCPFGQPGDRLWVRETFYEAGNSGQAYPEDDEYSAWYGSRYPWYSADGVPPVLGKNAWGIAEGFHVKRSFHPVCNKYWWRKRPSIHMPRWACRLVLEIVSVRVERVFDITEEDALAEGFKTRAGFLAVFGQIYGLKGRANPWVWVIEFKRAEATA